MKIGQLARETGVSVRMLRFYETQGLLNPSRSNQGYRDYDDAERLAVTRIRMLNRAGMTLKTIRVFLPCIRGERPVFEPCEELRLTLRNQLQRIDAEAQTLADQRASLARFLTEVEAA